MKRTKALAFLLALIMVVSIFSMTTMAAGNEVVVTTAAEVADAFAKVNDGTYAAGTVVKLGASIDITDCLTVADGKEMVLDLNGYALNGACAVQGHAMITNQGTLTINDSSAAGTGVLSYAFTGTGDASFGKGNYTISNSGGMLTVNGGKIENATASSIVHCCSAIDNNSTLGETILIVNGGHVFSNNRYAVRMYTNHGTALNKVVVNGGKLEGKTRGIWLHLPSSNTAVAPNSEIVVNGGEVKSLDTAGNYLAIYSYTYGNSLANTKITVTDGTITGNIGLSANHKTDVLETVSITGGFFNGEVYSYGTFTEGFISGGTFAEGVDEEYLVDGVATKTDADGNLVVGNWNQVVVEDDKAIVNDKVVSSAINNATENEVVISVKEEEAVTSVELPVTALDTIVEAEKELTIETTKATVTLDTAALEKVVASVDTVDSVVLVVDEIAEEVLTDDQKEAIEGKDVAFVFSAELLVNGESIATEADDGFGGGKATVKIPFTPEEGKGEDYKVIYIADDGKVTEIESTYEDGYLIIELEHFSEYAVVKEIPNPPTGDNVTMALVGIMAAVLLAGTAVVVKARG